MPNTPWFSLVAGNWSTSDIIAACSATIATITASFSTQTGKFTITNGTAHSITIPPNSIFGFSANHIVAATGSAISDYIPDISGTRYLNLISSINTDNITGGSVPLGPGVFCSIPVSSTPGQFILFSRLT